eukprot:TRINITY_DN20494_c0_g1_i1.p1 TRINITY_DN20494_c0_g1~~TRINITY_DN20494_c0_g1_i1.p1  ORF type:complete len:187 (-),score=26.77 TRINITY_DN20494_c0_g1_i1:3-539(-)
MCIRDRARPIFERFKAASRRDLLPPELLREDEEDDKMVEQKKTPARNKATIYYLLLQRNKATKDSIKSYHLAYKRAGRRVEPRSNRAIRMRTPSEKSLLIFDGVSRDFPRLRQTLRPLPHHRETLTTTHSPDVSISMKITSLGWREDERRASFLRPISKGESLLTESSVRRIGMTLHS